MAATSLPLELQQQIFCFLDTRSFYAARNVCRWWKYAARDTVTLSRQLQKLPILPPVEAAKSTPWTLQSVFNEAAHTLLVDLDIHRQRDELLQSHGSVSGSRTCATTNGERTVTLVGRTLTLYDTSRAPAKPLLQRSLNDLKETVGNGPWLRITPTTYNELALSSDGKLLAIAQERTIQVYNLSDEPDSFTVNEYISSAAGHYICGLDFEQNDHVLRVRLSGKGTVLYLGTPPTDSKSTTNADIEHWRSDAGLRHTFLDTSRFTLASASDDYTARVAGLQLLQPVRNGWLFAAQQHGGSESSRYILGHFKTSVPHNAHALTAEDDSITVLADLHSYLSAWKYSQNGHMDNGLGLWENMPSAHEHHPRFAMSADCSLLALGERDKKCIKPKPLAQLFLYRLPGLQAIQKTLEQQERRSSAKWASLESFLNRLESGRKAETADEKGTAEEGGQYAVGRLPVCLSTLQGDLTGLKFEKTEQDAYSLTAATADCLRTWQMIQR